MVSNFTNHLYTLAQDYFNENNLPYDILNPLIMETATRLNNYEAKDIQTGPSARGDNSTVLSHLKLLDNNEILKKIYSIFNKSIQEMYRK